MQGVQNHMHKMIQYVPCAMANLYWQYHEGTITKFFSDVADKQISGKENNRSRMQVI